MVILSTLAIVVVFTLLSMWAIKRQLDALLKRLDERCDKLDAQLDATLDLLPIQTKPIAYSLFIEGEEIGCIDDFSYFGYGKLTTNHYFRYANIFSVPVRVEDSG